MKVYLGQSNGGLFIIFLGHVISAISSIKAKEATTTHPPTTNSKLHDRAEIEQNSEKKSFQSIWGDPKTVFEPYPNPKNSPLGPQKSKMTPKSSQNQMSESKVT